MEWMNDEGTTSRATGTTAADGHVEDDRMVRTEDADNMPLEPLADDVDDWQADEAGYGYGV